LPRRQARFKHSRYRCYSARPAYRPPLRHSRSAGDDVKKRRKPYRHTRRSWLDIQLVIASASTESQDEDVHRWLATEAYAGLEKLVSGLFTMRDFAAMSKLCTFGHMLITEI